MAYWEQAGAAYFKVMSGLWEASGRVTNILIEVSLCFLSHSSKLPV